jgi:hypothetical protein
MKDDSYFLPKFNLGNNDPRKNTYQSDTKKLAEIKFWDEFYDFNSNKIITSSTNTTLINEPKIDSKLLRRHTVLSKKSSKYTPTIQLNNDSNEPKIIPRYLPEEKNTKINHSFLIEEEAPTYPSSTFLNSICNSGKNLNNKKSIHELQTIVPKSDPKTKELTFWNQLNDLKSKLDNPILAINERKQSASKSIVRRYSEKKFYEPSIQRSESQIVIDQESLLTTPRNRCRIPEKIIHRF